LYKNQLNYLSTSTFCAHYLGFLEDLSNLFEV